MICWGEKSITAERASKIDLWTLSYVFTWCYMSPYVCRYLQYDSWFYPKDAQKGLLEWIPDKKQFPSGMQWVNIVALYGDTDLGQYQYWLK